jgi:hypothetical protein
MAGRWPLASWGLLGMKRSTPERMYLLAEWGSRLPYRRAAELLNEMLPGLNRKISHTSLVKPIDARQGV